MDLNEFSFRIQSEYRKIWTRNNSVFRQLLKFSGEVLYRTQDTYFHRYFAHRHKIGSPVIDGIMN